MRGEGSVAAPALPRARARALLASHFLPALFFAIFFIDKIELLQVAVAVLAHRRLPTDVTYAIDQSLGVIYFGLIAFLYVIRLPQRESRRDPFTIAVSLFATFAITGVGILPGAANRPGLILLAAILLAAGLAYSIYALACLGRSFSILPEARRLVTHGPYSISRHPLYLGEATAGIGSALPNLSWAGIILVAVFLIAQLVRMRWEEEVLSREFPDQYPDYRRRVPMILPLPWKRY